MLLPSPVFVVEIVIQKIEVACFAATGLKEFSSEFELGLLALGLLELGLLALLIALVLLLFLVKVRYKISSNLGINGEIFIHATSQKQLKNVKISLKAARFEHFFKLS